MNLSKLWVIVEDRDAGHAMGSHIIRYDLVTEQQQILIGGSQS